MAAHDQTMPSQRPRLNLSNPNEARFEGYWGKMCQGYGGVTEAQFDQISKERRLAKTGPNQYD